MRNRLLAAAGLAGAALAAQAAGTVDVSFIEPTKYVDAGFGSVEIERTTRALDDFLQKLGTRLPDGQVLKIRVTDVDLAGNDRLTRQGQVRVLRGRADWPRITLDWQLLQGDRTLKTGHEDLADMNYLDRRPRWVGESELRYEKAMLADWFDKTFQPPH